MNEIYTISLPPDSDISVCIHSLFLYVCGTVGAILLSARTLAHFENYVRRKREYGYNTNIKTIDCP